MGHIDGDNGCWIAEFRGRVDCWKDFEGCIRECGSVAVYRV